MKKSVSHSIALGFTSAAAALSVPEVYDLSLTLFHPGRAGGLVEPEYFFQFIEKVCLVALLCEVAREVVLKKVRWLRLVLLGLLFVAAWTSWRQWFISAYAMLAVGLGLLCLYCESIFSDIKEVAPHEKEPNQAPEPMPLKRHGSS